MQAVEDHIESNKGVFDAHQKLVMNVIDAENALRDSAAEAGTGVSNGAYTVSVVPQTQEVWDEERTLSALRVTKEGAIAAKLLQVNQRPPRITISKNRS